MTISILAATLLFQSATGSMSAAPSAQWALLASDEMGHYWLDQTSIRNEGSVYRFRMRQQTREVPTRAVVVTYQLDCTGQTIAIESLDAFDTAGALVGTRRIPADWLDKDLIYAGTIDSRFYSRICPADVRTKLADRPPPPVMITRVTPSPPPMLMPVLPAPPPPPPATGYPVKRSEPVEPLTGLFSANDYPAAALRNHEEGSILYRLTIDKSGRVSGCEIVSSSGSATLDSATCRIIRTRARFRPARDFKGKKTADLMHGRILWRIPDDPLPTPPPPPQ